MSVEVPVATRNRVLPLATVVPPLIFVSRELPLVMSTLVAVSVARRVKVYLPLLLMV